MNDLVTFINEHPWNTDTTDRFYELVGLCYQMDNSGKSLEEFVEWCLDLYGGTVAGAMVSYLINH